jgi:bacteriorhodopsin
LKEAVFFDLCAILSGLIGSFLMAPLKWYSFGIGGLLALPLYIRIAHGCLSQYPLIKESTKRFYFLSIFAIYFVGWTLFPIHWIVSSEGLQIFSPDQDLIIGAILGFFTKDLTQFLYLNLLYLMSQSAGKAPQMEASQSQRDTSMKAKSLEVL